MPYIDGMVAAVPIGSKDAFRKHAEATGKLFKAYGALSVTECWGDDVPEGKTNSFHTAVLRKDSETVVFSWILWPDKAARDSAWPKIMADPAMSSGSNPMPFDGQRMIFGGFDVIVEV